MSSIISSLKRKLAFLASFVVRDDLQMDLPIEDYTEKPHPAKRRRLNGASTPVLQSDLASEESPNLIVESSEKIKATGVVILCCTEEETRLNGSNQPSVLLGMLPPHVLSKCFAFIASRSDRYALQTTCTLFRQLSNEEHMLVDIDLGGRWSEDAFQSHENNATGDYIAAEDDSQESDDEELGRTYDLDTSSNKRIVSVGGILSESDTSITACQKLIKFSAAGNMQATYMLAMILCYCLENVNEGLALLRLAAGHGDLRSLYNLALILRDTRYMEASHYLLHAAKYGYIPAWQEKLTPPEMRARFGDLDASSLSKYLDPPCLSRLLGRHYLECNRVKRQQTSHCWNPFCGKWAYKATSVRAERRRLQRDETEAQSNSSTAEERYSIRQLLPELPNESVHQNHAISPLGKIRRTIQYPCYGAEGMMKVSRMKMCSSCRRAKYCSKLCQVYDWRSGRHKAECPYLNA